MAASDYDFAYTRNEIVERAFRIVGVLPLGDTLSGDQSVQGVKALNSIVKNWQTQHLFLWMVDQGTVSLTGGTASVTLGSDPPYLTLEGGAIRINDFDHPLEVIALRDYQLIEQKALEGRPTHVAWDLVSGTVTAYFWPVPDDAYTFVFSGVRAAEDWDAAGGAGGFPARWHEALVYALAGRLADEYQLPLSERRELKNYAEELFLHASKSDREQPDCTTVRGAYD